MLKKRPHTLGWPRREVEVRRSLFLSDWPARGARLRAADVVRRAFRCNTAAARSADGSRRRTTFFNGFADFEIEFFEHASTNLSLRVGSIAYPQIRRRLVGRIFRFFARFNSLKTPFVVRIVVPGFESVQAYPRRVTCLT